jgi:hypothetical protein
MRALRTGFPLAISLLSLALASTASATWQLYGSGDFGYSIGIGKVSGSANVIGIPIQLSGKDTDASPLLGGAFGVQVPMDELTPWRLPRNWRLPDWPLRFEIEFVGLREYEFATPGLTPGAPFDSPFNTSASSWSMMNNIWLDVPLRGLYGPITSTSRFVKGRERLPTLREFLNSSTWYLGLGIGFAALDVATSDSILFGQGESFNFAYQFGTGFGYQLTSRTNLSVGYRFFRPGSGTMILRDTTLQELGFFKLKPDAHEVHFSLRILLYDLPYPWR